MHTRVLTQDDLDAMIQKSEFGSITTVIKLPAGHTDTEISLSFQDQDNCEFLISGFPRCLYDDEERKRGMFGSISMYRMRY